MQRELSPKVAEQGIVLSEPVHESTRQLSSPSQREQPCPQCGYPMSDLKGGREAICRNCGFKDSCCY
jgi:NADH pyrophosphatase NudC (nudix superfamily)